MSEYAKGHHTESNERHSPSNPWGFGRPQGLGGGKHAGAGADHDWSAGGKPRTVLLTSPLQENGNIVIVASRGGDDHHPAWFVNLRDNPQVQVKYKGGPTKMMTARIATSEERARMWPIVAATYKGYAGYQQKTTREIPLVLLTES